MPCVPTLFEGKAATKGQQGSCDVCLNGSCDLELKDILSELFRLAEISRFANDVKLPSI